jgi:uncharacterized membrane protein YoaK (UPF0700 family)
MIHYSRQLQVLAVALSAVAGYVDALGFLHFGGYFASFMSGNSTKLAVGLAGDHATVAVAAELIGLFVLGVMLGETVGRLADGRRPVSVLLVVSALLLGAAVLAQAGRENGAAALMVLAMGAENAVFQRNGDVSIGLTYMTGTIVKFGQRLTGALMGGEPFAWLPYGLLWCGLVAGAVTGATLYPALHLSALWGAAGASAATMVWARLLSDAAFRSAVPETRNRGGSDAQHG